MMMMMMIAIPTIKGLFCNVSYDVVKLCCSEHETSILPCNLCLHLFKHITKLIGRPIDRSVSHVCCVAFCS
jgi:hypothetical protein